MTPKVLHWLLLLAARRAGAVRFSIGALCSLLVWANAGAAATLQAPAGGDAIALPLGTHACGQPTGGWVLSGGGRSVRPPANAAVGTEASVLVATTPERCGSAAEKVTLVVMGPLPQIDPTSVTLSIAAGKLEFSGKQLTGLRVQWMRGTTLKSDSCIDVTARGQNQRCVLPVGQQLPADPSSARFLWAAEGGRFGDDVSTFDARGRAIPAAAMVLIPNRVIVGRLLPRARSVDLSRGFGELELNNPEAVANVECDGAQCELVEHTITVRAVPVSTRKIAVRIRLAPRVVVARGDAFDNSFTTEFEIVRCDLKFVSGAPLRDVDDVHILVRLPQSCGFDAERLNWSVNSDDASVEQVELDGADVFVLLRASRIVESRVDVTASRPQDQSVLAFSNIETVRLPAIHTSLFLGGFGEIDFIPKNQDVSVAASTIAGGRLVPIEVAGAYTVREAKDGAHIRGVYMSTGYTALRLAYRVDGVPSAFAKTNFAAIVDPIQRPIREANVPISLGAASLTDKPVLELRCAVKGGRVARITPGVTQHIPFADRDSCRLLVHRALIPEDSGEQLVEIDVNVTTAGDTERADARLTERLILRHGKETDVIWIRGALGQFDRINVRVQHVVEEGRYLLGRGGQYRLPVGQWTVVTEDATLKFYATAAIPSGLYRFSNDKQDLGTGALALNFGVLSRLTLLSDDGKESLIGLEGGVMTMGLSTEKDRQLAVVTGIGFGVPLGNVNQPTQASLNIHAWVAYSIGHREGQLTNDLGEVIGNLRLNPWAIVFGPSITIGSLAAFL